MANLSGLFNLKLGGSLPTKQQVKDYVNIQAINNIEMALSKPLCLNTQQIQINE